MYLTDLEYKLTVDEINAFNAYFDHHLPTSFLDFYLKNNGGYPNDNEENNPFMLGGFNPIKYGDLPIEKLYCDLIESFGELRIWFPLPMMMGGTLFYYLLNLMIH